MKKNNNLVIGLFIGCLLMIVLLVVWDMLTCSACESLTVLPWEVDWKAISFKNTDVNSYIQTILSAVIGFDLTIIFLEIILKKSRDKEIAYKRDVQLKNIAKILKAPLFRYRKAALSISYKTGQIPKDFKMQIPDYNVLKEIFFPQPFSEEPLHESKIEYYSNTLDDLSDVIKNILLNTDLSDNEELSSIFSDYLNIMYTHNPCRSILAFKTLTVGGKRMSDNLINEDSTMFEHADNPGHIYHPIYVLQGIIKYHEEFLEKLFKIAPKFTVDLGLINNENEQNRN